MTGEPPPRRGRVAAPLVLDLELLERGAAQRSFGDPLRAGERHQPRRVVPAAVGERYPEERDGLLELLVSRRPVREHVGARDVIGDLDELHLHDVDRPRCARDRDGHDAPALDVGECPLVRLVVCDEPLPVLVGGVAADGHDRPRRVVEGCRAVDPQVRVGGGALFRCAFITTASRSRSARCASWPSTTLTSWSLCASSLTSIDALIGSISSARACVSRTWRSSSLRSAGKLTLPSSTTVPDRRQLCLPI